MVGAAVLYHCESLDRPVVPNCLRDDLIDIFRRDAAVQKVVGLDQDDRGLGAQADAAGGDYGHLLGQPQNSEAFLKLGRHVRCSQRPASGHANQDPCSLLACLLLEL